MKCFKGRSVDLLPGVLQQQLKNGNLPEVGVFPVNQSSPAKLELPKTHEPILGNLLFKDPQSATMALNIPSLNHK
ncbi:hypothetical protein BUALT_Bualt10G0021900 [Buddleja alternifolia]|uniref:Uncharacterized protein n=1 Tax=Buddleja alternifolia TaxID=168488 RepID=A0AAV6WWW4_9LAMI|nr:hypothetical protein BUALT_Bualt10G0021900 [Buddleja alternifolia]